MDFASPLLELVKSLWGLASKPLGSICNLKDNVEALKKETTALEAMNRDVMATVEREEAEARVQRTNQVKNWLGEVQEFKGGVDQVLQEAGERDQIKCLTRCLPRNCWSSYKLGKRVDQLLNEAGKLQRKKGELGNFTSPLPPPPVLPMPMDETMGLDMSLNKVRKWLMDGEKKRGVIGLYGKGGVGKTTLMKRINNELLSANHGFEIVIWVVVSKQMNEDNIRDTIGERLNIKDKGVHSLLEVLTHKKFVLLIDDVWERLDLSEIGVPCDSLKNGSKVVFTTRLKQVCDQMEADGTCEVQCLMPEEALTLFKKNVGKVLENCPQEIQDLANVIAEECDGLPLALVTVGRAMAGKDDPRDWRHALTTLRHKPHELKGMVAKVFHILKFSYDSLDDATQQACFLYCCRFPEDYLIIADELIELWIGEGLLGNTNNIYCKRDQGASILGDLKRACLLESELNSIGEAVKMHDIIRDMATWIARDHGQKENKLLVIENEEDMSMMMPKWGEAEKVSLWGRLIGNINQTPPMCSQLKTLFVRKTNVGFMPGGFFESMMACLKVLDLSDNRNIELFPEKICDLINLQYLNMSNTRIGELPKEIKNLTRLRWLLLNGVSKTFLIPTGVIASVPWNVFSMWESGIEMEEEVVEELGGMQELIDLSIVVHKSSSALKIFQSFQRCIRRVNILDGENLTCIPISHSLKERNNFLHLEVLHLQKCSKLVKMEITQGTGQVPDYSCFPSLVEVVVRMCGFSDLSWLVHAPKLQKLIVRSCCRIEKVIGDEVAGEDLVASGLFSRLKFLEINSLTEIKSICDHTLFFAQGAHLTISFCRSLKKLPWDSSNARRSFSISADWHWWPEFEWDPTARVTFSTFRPWGVGSEEEEEEMTFGEAVRKMNDRSNWASTIGFRPSGPSE